MPQAPERMKVLRGLNDKDSRRDDPLSRSQAPRDGAALPQTIGGDPTARLPSPVPNLPDLPAQGPGAAGASEGDGVASLTGATAATPTWWSEAVRLKDTMGLRDLADYLGVRVGVLAAELRRAGVARQLPADELGEQRPVAQPGRRVGSKDSRIEQFLTLLGSIPDSEIARLADVSVRTVASYRARNGLSGFRGPRRRPETRGRRDSRLEDYRHMLGRLPDRVVADESGMSLGAVRNFRIKHAIAAAGRMSRRETDRILADLSRGEVSPARAAPAPPPALPSGASMAWRIVLESSPHASLVVLACGIVEACQRAVQLAHGDASQVRQVERLGTVVTDPG